MCYVILLDGATCNRMARKSCITRAKCVGAQWFAQWFLFNVRTEALFLNIELQIQRTDG